MKRLKPPFGWFFSSPLKERRGTTTMGNIHPSNTVSLDNIPCPIMPNEHPNRYCNCPRALLAFSGNCHASGKCRVIALVPGAKEEAVRFTDQHV